MKLNDEAKLLRRWVAQLRPGKGRKYTTALRRRILAWVDRAKRSGMLEIDCSEALGIPQTRFVMWRKTEPAAKPEATTELAPAELPLDVTVEPVSKELVPIEVAESMLTPAGLALVSPSGWRVDGLTLEQAYALLREFA